MYRPKHAKYQMLRRVIRILAVVILVFILLYPFLEPYRIQVERTSLESDMLSPDVRQLRIVFVSDIHEQGFPFFTSARTIDLVRSINALNPDLILLGGDYATSPESAVLFFGRLAENRLRANYGIYGVLGEHDRELERESITLLRSAMLAAGVTPLVNDAVSLRVGTSTVTLVGLDDVTRGWPDLAGTAAQVEGGSYTIFLCHNPQIIPSLMQSVNSAGKRNWFQLGLFGHTMGGQIVLLGDVLHLTDSVSAAYAGGWTRENRIPLLISNGIGTVTIPARLFRPPQIHLITVKSTAK